MQTCWSCHAARADMAEKSKPAECLWISVKWRSVNICFDVGHG